MTTECSPAVSTDGEKCTDLKGALSAAEIDVHDVDWVVVPLVAVIADSVRCTGTTALTAAVMSESTTAELSNDATRMSSAVVFNLSAGIDSQSGG